MEVWREPAQPRHPLVGIVYALSRAAGRDVLVCAADLPFITPAALGLLAGADAGGAPAVLASAPGSGLQPLLGRYRALCGTLLAAAAREGTAPVRAAVMALEPRLVELEDSAAAVQRQFPGRPGDRGDPAASGGRQPKVKS